MNTINLITLSVYLLITGPQAAAQSHPNGKAGGEWTFSRPELIEAGRNIELRYVEEPWPESMFAGNESFERGIERVFIIHEEALAMNPNIH